MHKNTSRPFFIRFFDVFYGNFIITLVKFGATKIKTGILKIKMIKSTLQYINNFFNWYKRNGG